MVSRRVSLVVLLASAAFLAGAWGKPPAGGGLSFDKYRAEHTVKPTENNVVAKFPFKNETGKAVVVEDVHTNCGCIRAGADKKVYAAGESGVIEAEFRVGSLKGLIEKTVTVQTNIKERRLQTLNVVMRIPTLVEIKPDLTEWLIGSEPEPKEVLITMKHNKPIRVVNSMSSRANVDHEIVTVKEGEIYKIILTPRSTEKLMLGVLRIETDCEIDKYKKQMAFFGVVKTKRNRS